MYQANQHEQDILKYWQENNIFERSIHERSKDTPYVFYDGPPFATGLPHYGHIMAGTKKDTIPRYFTMRGYRVERQWGWDCHGLPIENLIEKELNLPGKKEIEAYGVDTFNEACRSKVLAYEEEWKKIIPRMGRWIDMDSPYMTMDKTYMESVWWVFSELYKKGYIYEGKKPMHVCPHCVTPLSNFEVTQGYKDIKDLSVTAKFKLNNAKEKLGIDGEVSILAWTTTPWTLPGNVLLAVGEDIQYSIFNIEGEEGGFVVAKDLVESVIADKRYTVVQEVFGRDLVGLTYEPIFPYFTDLDGAEHAFRVLAADFVTTEDGTGIVHLAPAFGTDDYEVFKKENVPFIQHVNMDGTFIDEVIDFAGMNVKPVDDHMKTDIEIIKWLAHHGKLFSKKKYEHSYPHCWRCDTPLLNYATTSWFVEVTKIQKALIDNNQKIHWVPEHIKDGRFGKWLEGVKDWSISRNRFWGTPLPIWKSDDGDVLCIGSVKELETLTGEVVKDLHSHNIDHLTITQDGKTYRRIPEILDTWFDSGCVPYGQKHYPFENKASFEAGFPADFIAESQDQTRGWFYTLHVLATALTHGDAPSIPVQEGKPAFTHVSVNGIILAEDGKKMSKRLQNYPDPMEVVEKYGADAIRYYLLSSSVMKGESLNFSEQQVREVFNKVMNTLWNVTEFYTTYASGDVKTDDSKKNVLDRWIMARLGELQKEVTEHMEQYYTAEASRPIMDFISDLSQWYVRRSRDRFKGLTSEEDKVAAVATLKDVLMTLSKIMAPFTPFIAEKVYQVVTGTKESVHLEMWPESFDVDEHVLKEMAQVRKVVEMGLSLRKEAGIKVRQPLQKLSLFHIQCAEDLREIIAEELNVKQVVLEDADNAMIIKEDGGIKIALDTHITEELEQEGLVRGIVRAINMMRKEQKLTVEDMVVVTYHSDDMRLARAFEQYAEDIKQQTLAREVQAGDAEVEQDIEGRMCRISLTRV